jgi:hypothetical protein
MLAKSPSSILLRLVDVQGDQQSPGLQDLNKIAKDSQLSLKTQSVGFLVGEGVNNVIDDEGGFPKQGQYWWQCRYKRDASIRNEEASQKTDSETRSEEDCFQDQRA